MQNSTFIAMLDFMRKNPSVDATFGTPFLTS